MTKDRQAEKVLICKAFDAISSYFSGTGNFKSIDTLE